MKSHKVVILCLCSLFSLYREICAATSSVDQDLNDISDKVNRIKVNKCCEKNEVMIDSRCTDEEETNITAWIPVFTTENGVDNVQVKGYEFVIGKPACETTQNWPIYHLPDSENMEDKLVLLPSGKLRHYIHHQKYLQSLEDKHGLGIKKFGRINEPVPVEEEIEKDPFFYDYEQGKYCMEKMYITSKSMVAQYALVCAPEVNINWSTTDFLMRKVINPLFHGIAIVCFLIVSIIYFVLPTLRDLHGNIVTTINVCLIFSQAADLVRIFTQFSSHISFMVADSILYISLLAAFFWLNSMGYYIWKTFKSRNVFLRVTDGRKYCYYSCYAWGCTLLMACLALFAHFMLDLEGANKQYGRHKANSFITNGNQETIGWLGIAVFFTPIAFTVIIDIFFYVTTMKVINRMNTYGRIHHKLKHNFDMFLLLFLVMVLAWLFLLMSWLNLDGLMYAHIIINSLQGPLILYICVFRQKHVMFLLRKSCCYSEPVPTSDWGDEMTQMNGSSY